MTEDVVLRLVTPRDLDVFFEQQRDPVANQMAAFAAPDPTDRAAFSAHWARLLADDLVVVRAVQAGGQVAGNVLMFPHGGQLEVGYWLGREFWGRGIATAALREFLRQVETRPLYARVAKDNLASLRVLRKCGFAVIGEDRAFAHGRLREVEEHLLRLPATSDDRSSPEPPRPAHDQPAEPEATGAGS